LNPIIVDILSSGLAGTLRRGGRLLPLVRPSVFLGRLVCPMAEHFQIHGKASGS